MESPYFVYPEEPAAVRSVARLAQPGVGPLSGDRESGSTGQRCCIRCGGALVGTLTDLGVCSDTCAASLLVWRLITIVGMTEAWLVPGLLRDWISLDVSRWMRTPFWKPVGSFGLECICLTCFAFFSGEGARSLCCGEQCLRVHNLSVDALMSVAQESGETCDCLGTILVELDIAGDSCVPVFITSGRDSLFFEEYPEAPVLERYNSMEAVLIADLPCRQADCFLHSEME